MSGSANAAAIRRAYPQVLARILARTRSLPDAQDAVQEAVARALAAWPASGPPDSPEAWLCAVAANAHRDRLRRGRTEALGADALGALAQLHPQPPAYGPWNDELLGLLFACCHPALEPGESAALALSSVLGLSVTELGAAFMLPVRSMEQRLTRARRRLRERGDLEGAPPERAGERLQAVLTAILLLYNEGYWSSADGPPIRAELCRLATGLAQSLVEAFPAHAEVVALRALLELHEARRPARIDSQGRPVPLADQDRSRWDHARVRDATRWLEAVLGRDAAGPMQIEAAIAAVHCQAQHAKDTDWQEIAALYALLEPLRPIAPVRVNRAFALGRAAGAARGLALLEQSDIDISGYPYRHLVRGALLEELGLRAEALQALHEAARAARNEHERGQIDERIARLERR